MLYENNGRRVLVDVCKDTLRSVGGRRKASSHGDNHEPNVAMRLKDVGAVYKHHLPSMTSLAEALSDRELAGWSFPSCFGVPPLRWYGRATAAVARQNRLGSMIGALQELGDGPDGAVLHCNV